jgi:hypothetical protein
VQVEIEVELAVVENGVVLLRVAVLRVTVLRVVVLRVVGVIVMVVEDEWVDENMVADFRLAVEVDVAVVVEPPVRVPLA